jgi:UDP-glucose 4-epimerase
LAQRILVTGGAGFIGSHVVQRFLDAGWSVEVIDDLSRGKRDNLPPGVTLHVLDVRSPEAAQLVEKGRFNAVAHLAAQMDVRKSVADPGFDASVNIVGSLNIAEALRRGGGKARLVFASTGGALYGDFAKPPNREGDAKDPESPYGIAKLSVEYYLAYYGRLHGMESVALRFGNVYGPRQDPHGEAGVVAIFCGRILDGKTLTVNGNGDQTRDYVYVGDVASAFFTASNCALPKAERLDARGFNIGTGVATSVNDLAKTLIRVAGSGVNIEHAPARPGEQMHSVLAIAKAEKELGWRPTVSIEAGLKETFEWFAARQHSAAGRGA